MSVKVDPFVIPIPQKWRDDPEIFPTISYLWRYLYDLRERTGGANDIVASNSVDLSAITSRVVVAENDIDSLQSDVDAAQLSIIDLQSADIGFDSRITSTEADLQVMAMQDITAQLLAEVDQLKKRIEALEIGTNYA